MSANITQGLNGAATVETIWTQPRTESLSSAPRTLYVWLLRVPQAAWSVTLFKADPVGLTSPQS